jgi:hypothetical protein
MDGSSEDLRALVDRDKIRQCLERLARGEDRRIGEMIAASMWPDSISDYGVFKGDFDAYYAWVIPGADAITNTQHVLGQSFIELDGDRARAETQVLSYHRVDMGVQENDTIVGGRYLDVFEKRGGQWRIAERTMLYDWYHDWGQAIDWSQGVMGLPLSQEWFAGRARGDYSTGFFGRKGQA